MIVLSYFLSFGFLFLSLFFLLDVYFYILSFFIMKIKKSYVFTDIVYKFFRIQSITRQPLSYFDIFVSKKDLHVVDAKEKSKHRTWFTLVVEVLNGFLYQVILFKISISLAYFLHFLYISFVFVIHLDFYYHIFSLLCVIFHILIYLFLSIAKIRGYCCCCLKEIL